MAAAVAGPWVESWLVTAGVPPAVVAALEPTDTVPGTGTMSGTAEGLAADTTVVGSPGGRGALEAAIGTADAKDEG